jgi:radical SAM-linked protein
MQVYIGHLDLLNVYERALRRAAIPVAMDSSPFHARPRIKTALPLPLGASSLAEIMEVELTQRMDPEEFRRKFAEQLPQELPILSVGRAHPNAHVSQPKLDPIPYPR